MSHNLRGTAGEPAKPEIDTAGLSDLLMRFNIGYAVISGHIYKIG
jgi:hypothetical protein